MLPVRRAKLTCEAITGVLRYEASAAMPAPNRVVGLTIQRSDGERPGPIIAHLLAPDQINGAGTLTMRGRDRENLVAGRLYLHFYARQSPLGASRQQVVLR